MAHARWIFVAMLVVVAAAISVSDGSGRTANVAARLVLVKADVGASYERNAAFSRPRAILSVDLTGQQGTLRPALLMTLARRQDAKAVHAGF
jgi:hypothetical protein